MVLRFVASTILLVAGIVVGGLISEVGFRLFLLQKSPQSFIANDEKRPNVWFLSEPRWVFHEDYGYEYGVNKVHGGSSSSGEVTSCWSWPVNSRGNMGLIEGDYHSADLKIAVFGDSFTAQIDTGYDPRGITWPDFLQSNLEKKLDKKVHVLNFGRDGTGILHMSDLAADMVAKWVPDVVIFAFITDDLTRARFWRTATKVDGRDRMFTTTVPEKNPPLEKSADTAILHYGANQEWCEKTLGTGVSSDPILLEMEATVNEAKARLTGLADPYDMKNSFLFDKLVNGSAFFHTKKFTRASQNPRHTMTDFSQDKRFVENVKAIRESGARLILLHLAVYEELVSGNEYLLDKQQQQLLNSLETQFESKIRESIVVKMPAKGYETIKRSANDSHPSVTGMQFYAEAAAIALTK